MDETVWDEREHEGIEGIVSRLPTYFSICCLSCRNSGKSVLMTQLVRELIRLRKIDVAICFSQTNKLVDDWEFLNTPKSQMVMPFDEETLSLIIKKQRADIIAWKNPPKDGRDKPPKPRHCLIIFDDCLSSDAERSKLIESLFTLGRHLWISTILISQSVTRFPTRKMKENMDMCLWSKLNESVLENLHACTTNISKRDFIRLSENLAGVEYNFMCLDLYDKTSRDPLDTITVIRAKAPVKKKSR